MLRFSANISTLYTELPLLERFSAAASQGFRAIEIQFPYTEPLLALSKAYQDSQLEVVLINMPAGNLEQGELGFACVPGREEDFLVAIDDAIRYANALQCNTINCLVGNIPEGETRENCWQVLLNNIQQAAQAFDEYGIQLLVEVLNPVDFPHFILSTMPDWERLVKGVNYSNLALQYDVYHRRAANEDWLLELKKHSHVIKHIQFSDYPGRHQPGTGELDMSLLFQLIEALPYQGWTGCEYKPTGITQDSFKWLEPFKQYLR